MGKENDIELDEEVQDDVQDENVDGADKDEFEYDEDGNIIIPDVIDDADGDDGDEPAEIEGEETNDEGTTDSDAGKEKQETAEKKPEGNDKDAQIEELKKQLETARAKEKEYEALKAQSADTLAKLGVKSENPLEGLEKVAAESDDMSLDDYRKKKAEAQQSEAAKRLLQQTMFEKKMQDDFAELQREFPETRGMKSLREIDNLAKFGRFRDLGLSAKEAYAAANPDSVRRNVAAATKQQALNETKAHLKTAVPTGAKDDGITISRRELAEWRDLFPDLSDKEISKLYKESAKK